MYRVWISDICVEKFFYKHIAPKCKWNNYAENNFLINFNAYIPLIYGIKSFWLKKNVGNFLKNVWYFFMKEWIKSDIIKPYAFKNKYQVLVFIYMRRKTWMTLKNFCRLFCFIMDGVFVVLQITKLLKVVQTNFPLYRNMLYEILIKRPEVCVCLCGFFYV